MLFSFHNSKNTCKGKSITEIFYSIHLPYKTRLSFLRNAFFHQQPLRLQSKSIDITADQSKYFQNTPKFCELLKLNSAVQVLSTIQVNERLLSAKAQ